MDTYKWLLLTYKVPAEPASKRVALWRRLKGMGAGYLQNGVCLLPKTDDHVRRLKMLENDITEMGGDAVILATVRPRSSAGGKGSSPASKPTGTMPIENSSTSVTISKPKSPKKRPAQHFTYNELEENDVELKKTAGLARKDKKARFLRRRARLRSAERLKGCESLLDNYAQRVFDAHDENR